MATPSSAPAPFAPRHLRPALVVLAAVLVLAAPASGWGAYIETPSPVHAPIDATTLIDLTPPGALLTPGVLSPTPGRVSLLPGPGGGVYFLPNFSSGPRSCFGGSVPGLAGVECLFTDNVLSPVVGWHGEFLVHNASGGILAFNAAFFDGWGNVYAGRAVLGIDSSLYVDLHLGDIPEQGGSDLGLALVWAASTVPALLDVTFTVSEKVTAGNEAGTVPCPLRVASIQGLTPIGAFGCSFTFFSDPANDKWEEGPDDPTLGRFGFMDPADLANADVFPQLPQPASLVLLAVPFALVLTRRAWRGARL